MVSQNDAYGAIQVDANNKTLVSITGNNSIECYIPYNLYLSGFQFIEMDKDIKDIYDIVPKVRLQIKKTLSTSREDNINETIDETLDKYSFSAYNETKGRRIYGIEIRGNTILILDENTSIGDVLRISVNSKDSSIDPFEFSVQIDENLSASKKADVIERGYFKASVKEADKDNRDFGILIFDESGKNIKTITKTKNDDIVSEQLKRGRYKVVFLKKAGHMWRLNNLDEYEEMGFVEGNDYILKTLDIVNGEIVDLDNVLVPSFDEEKLSYFDKRNTFFMTNVDKVLVGGLIEYRMQYKFKEQYIDRLDNISLKIELPESAILVDNSITLNSESVEYTVRNNTLTVEANEAEGVLRFYIKPFESSNFETKGKISFYYNRYIEETVGIAVVSAPYITIEGNETTNFTDISIRGVSNVGKEIKIFDGESNIGTTRTDNKGKWSTKVQLSNPREGSIHNIYATTIDDSAVERTSNILEVKYGKNQPELTEFTMYHGNQKFDILDANNRGSRNHATFNPRNPFSFIVKVRNQDLIDKVYITSIRNNEKKRMQAIYDSNKGCWIAKGQFDPGDTNYVPGTITVEYVLKEKREDIVVDSDLKFTDDQLKAMLPEEWKDAIVQIKEQTESKLVADIDLDSDSGKTIGLKVNTNNNYKVLSHEEYRSQGYTPIKSKEGKITGYSLVTMIDDEIRCYLVDWTKGQLEEVIVSGVADCLGINTSIASNMFSIGKDVIEYGGRTINISEAKKAIMNSNLSTSEKNLLMNDLNDLQATITAGLIMGAAITVVGATVTLPLSSILLIGLASHLLNDGISAYYDMKMEEIESLLGGYSFIWKIDPSGYIYEVTPDNRLEGVTVYAFTREDGESILWDAEEFEQINPLTTDAEGRYAWDVPEGQWQVKAELDGYETVFSEWLPVPPPQTEVNLAMVSLIEPGIEQVSIYEDYGRVDFDKYIPINMINEEAIDIFDSNEIAIDENYEPIDIVELDNVKLAKKFLVRWTDKASIINDDLYTITVREGIKSYAGVELVQSITETSRAKIEVEDVIFESNLNMYYGQTIDIPVRVLPANATNGLSVIAESSVNDIVTVDYISNFDEDGIAYISISSQLPGAVDINFIVEGTDIIEKIRINVDIRPDFIPDDNYIIWDESTISDIYHDWAIEFSKDLDSSTSNIRNIYVIDEEGNKLDFITPVIEGKTIKLINDGSFQLNHKYYIVIEEDVRSIEGETIEKGIKKPFIVN